MVCQLEPTAHTFQVFGLEPLDLRAKIRFPFLKRFHGNNFAVEPTYRLREEASEFSPIDGVGVEDAESSVALFFRRIGCDAFGLHGVGQRRAEEVTAQPTDIGECGSRCNQRDSCFLRHFSHDRKIF